MKPLWLFLGALVMLGIPCMAHADDQRSPSITIGAKGGVSWVKWYRGGPTPENATPLLYFPSFSGTMYGLIDWRIAPRLNIGIQPELAFVRRGTDTDFDGSKGAEFRMDYIETLILARTGVPISELSNLFFMIGPRLGVLLQMHFRDPNGSAGKIDEGYERRDFGLNIGFGAEISPSKQFNITIEGRFDLGFIDLASASTDVDVRNQGFSAMIGVNWSLLGDTK